MHRLHVYLRSTDRVFVSSLFRFALVVCSAYLVIARESRSEIVEQHCSPGDASFFEVIACHVIVTLSLATQKSI